VKDIRRNCIIVDELRGGDGREVFRRGMQQLRWLTGGALQVVEGLLGRETLEGVGWQDVDRQVVDSQVVGRQQVVEM
jgi:hypothetical protein